MEWNTTYCSVLSLGAQPAYKNLNKVSKIFRYKHSDAESKSKNIQQI